MNTIAELNDAFRKSFVGGRVVMTASVDALPATIKAAVMAKVRSFDKFTPDNDPHGEHDFAAFNLGGERFNFKIDYYAPDMLHGSEDPADPKQTVRILTIMLAADY